MSKAAGSRGERKAKYYKRLSEFLHNYDKILIVHVDNVGSNQLQQIRAALRDKGTVLMGKNTLVKRVITEHAKELPGFQVLLPHIVGNVGFVFVDCDLVECRDIIVTNRLPAAAKSGAIAPVDVVVPKGNTGLEPNQTSFLQALNISTKISRGQVEILRDVNLIKKGDIVEPSQSALLNKLGIRPFSYGAEIQMVYEKGCVFEPSILDVGEEDIIAKFTESVKNIAAVSLTLGYPTVTAVPHLMLNSFKNLVAVALETDYDFPEMLPYKEFLADPSKFAAVVEEEKKEEAPVEEEPEQADSESESEDEDGDLDDLFG